MYWWEERVFDGVAKFAVEKNWILDSRMRWVHSEDHLSSWKGDGIIANPGFSQPLENLVRIIQDAEIPAVGLQKFGPLKYDARVVTDHLKIGREAALHLISREFRNLAYVRFADNELEDERCQGFRSAVEQAGLTFTEIPFASLKEKLASLPKPIALMAANDFNANDTMTVCIESGFSIPSEIAIIGADDSKAFCEHTEVPLSSVRCKFEEQGYQAAAILDQLMSGERSPLAEMKIGADGVTERRSTDTIAVDDAQTRKTLSVIRERFREPIKVKDIAKLVGVSSRSLQTSFKENLGFTMSEELSRLRLNHAKVLLATTSQKIESIAYECGFSGRHHFIRSFKREFETTPTEFRNMQP